MEEISLHILDIAENSVNAGATLIRIGIEEDPGRNLLTVTVEDNGRGIPKEFLDDILNPFSTTRTERRVGLGLSLLGQSAEETGGEIAITSRLHVGTTVIASFRTDHIDMKPVGNLADTILTLIVGNPSIDFVFSCRVGDHDFTLDTREIKADLGDIPIGSPAVISFLRTLLRESTRAIQG